MTFFSWISTDIHRLIASKLLPGIENRYENDIDYIKSEKNIMALLAYSDITPGSCQAVLRSLEYSLIPWYWSNEVLTESIKRFANELTEINLSRTQCFSFCGKLPELPKLKKAVILANLDHTELIKKGKNIVDLKILFESNYEWSWIVSCVQALNLKSLELNYIEDRYQVLQDLSIEELISLSNACKTVERLTLKGYLEMTPEIDHMISQFRCLKRLSIEGEIPETSIPVLYRVRELEFSNLSSISLRTVSVLGAQVKEINGLVADFEDMDALRSFPRLKKLEIQPVENVHEVLKDVVWSVQALTIHMDFELDSINALPGGQDNLHVIRRFKKLNVPVLIKILQRANSLTFLSLKNMILSSQDIQRILRTTGRSLKHIQISIDWQHEITWMRIFHILKAIAKYCPNLEDLRFLEDDTSSPKPIIARAMQKASCEKALRALSRTSRNFKSFNRNMRFIQHRFIAAASEELVWDDFIPFLLE